MATRNDEVMEMVRRELEQRPDAPLAELYERAQEIDPSISEMSTRQFHAKYPLQIKRARGAGARTGTRTEGRQQRGQRRSAQPQAAEQRREEAAEQRPGRRTRQQRQEEAGPDRDAIRGVFLQFASDFAQAESRPQIVGVLSNIDTYVDQVAKLVSRS